MAPPAEQRNDVLRHIRAPPWASPGDDILAGDYERKKKKSATTLGAHRRRPQSSGTLRGEVFFWGVVRRTGKRRCFTLRSTLRMLNSGTFLGYPEKLFATPFFENVIFCSLVCLWFMKWAGARKASLVIKGCE